MMWILAWIGIGIFAEFQMWDFLHEGWPMGDYTVDMLCLDGLTTIVFMLFGVAVGIIVLLILGYDKIKDIVLFKKGE